jgi:hypothetical protein
MGEGERLWAELLDKELVRTVQAILPDDVRIEPGLVSALMESWDLDEERNEAILFVCRRFLEDLQEEVIEVIHTGWPPSSSGDLPSPEVSLDTENDIIEMSYVDQDNVVLVLPRVFLRDIKR